MKWHTLYNITKSGYEHICSITRKMSGQNMDNGGKFKFIGLPVLVHRKYKKIVCEVNKGRQNQSSHNCLQSLKLAI